jgi:hypothetical protein
MPFSSAICDEIKYCSIIDSCDMQQGGESMSLQDLECVSTTFFGAAYNLNEKRDQMFGFREELEKKYVASASPSVIDKSVQEQVEHVPPEQWMQNNVLPSLNERSSCIPLSTIMCEELLDRDAEIMCSIMPYDVQIEDITRIDDSTEIIVVPLPLGVDKYGCSTATIGGQNSFEDFMNQSDDEDVTANIVVQVMQQNPCEDESYITKLSARENKSELCDSTK